MKHRHGQKLKNIILGLCFTVLLVLVIQLDAVQTLSYAVEDSLYQNEQALDGTIAVIGIDSHSLDEYGPWPWDRAVIAEAVRILNADPLSRPAAIGLDIVYSGATDKQSDAALVNAASAGNVVIACTGEIGTSFELDENGQGSIKDFELNALLYPFDELAENSLVGHTNAMFDSDGVLRHHLWEIDDGHGGKIPSLPYKLYTLYCAYHNITPDFLPAQDERGFWRVDFAGNPGAYFTYSVSDILSGNFDPVTLEGAIVLIGPYDMGLRDSYISAINHAEHMYGVEYLANVTDAMLRGESKLNVSPLLQTAAFAVVCFICALCFFTYRVWIGAFVLVAVNAAWLGSCVLMYENGYVLSPISVTVGTVLCFLSSLIYHYSLAKREKKYIRNTFERYVDPSILQKLLSEDAGELGLGGKTCDIAVLFVDLRGFTALSEKMPAQNVVGVLNEYFALTSRCIKQNGGTLDKFVGDCTMAIWGAPIQCADPAFNACRAAMDMADGAAQLAATIFDKYGCHVEFGIGVHYGSAVVGNIGAPERMDYTAIGDTVNTASRLEASAPAGKIYISRSVADALGERAGVATLGHSIELKGKSAGFEVLVLNKLNPQQ